MPPPKRVKNSGKSKSEASKKRHTENGAENKKPTTRGKALSFPSPTESEGPRVPSPRDISSVGKWLQAASRSRPSGKSSSRKMPIGFPEHHNMCYRNSALSMLMNIPSFIIYLEHYSSEREKGENKEAMEDGDGGENVLTILGEMATAYWSAGLDEERRARLYPAIKKLWVHLESLGDINYEHPEASTVSWGPFLDDQQQETQQDAGDFLENLLTNCDSELQKSGPDRKEYNIMMEARFQSRTTCAGNCNKRRIRRQQLDCTRLWTVNIDRSKGISKGALEDSIRTTMTNEIDLTCENCKTEMKIYPGHIWQTLLDAPEILLIRISRFEWSKEAGAMQKLDDRVDVPETLDMTSFLEKPGRQAGVQARYRLCGTVNHAGNMDVGHFVSHVRGPGEEWYRLEDQYASPSSIEILNKDPTEFHDYKFTPYLLAYTRTLKECDEVIDLTTRPHGCPDYFTPSFLPAIKNAAPLPIPNELSLRVISSLYGHSFVTSHKLNIPTPGGGFDANTSHLLALHVDVVDSYGNLLLSANEYPALLQLIPDIDRPLSTDKRPLASDIADTLTQLMVASKATAALDADGSRYGEKNGLAVPARRVVSKRPRSESEMEAEDERGGEGEKEEDEDLEVDGRGSGKLVAKLRDRLEVVEARRRRVERVEQMEQAAAMTTYRFTRR